MSRDSTGWSSGSETLAKVGEVGDIVGDLRPRGRDEMVEEPRGNVLLLGGELRHRAFEVLLDDVLGTAERVERLGAQGSRTRRPLLVPEALHDELEVRRLDARAGVGGVDCTKAPERRARSGRRRPRRAHAPRERARPNTVTPVSSA